MLHGMRPEKISENNTPHKTVETPVLNFFFKSFQTTNKMSRFVL